MSGRARQFLGLGLLLAVVLAVVGFQLRRDDAEPVAAPSGPEPITVAGRIGSEKEGFLQSQAVREILATKYGLTVNATNAGSLDMVREPRPDEDFLWPSSEVALALFREEFGSAAPAETIFNSPIVLYAWSDVTKALIAAGLVAQEGETYYVNDFPRLVRMIDEGRTWADVGLPTLYGGVAIFTTDPTRSNSGNMFSGLLANTLNNGQVVDETTVGPHLPTIRRFYDRLGLLQNRSGDLFNQFLSQGIGAMPMIAGYESQLTEFSLASPDYREVLRERINVLYPRPTVFSSHPVIALTPNGERLLAALRDPELQRIAWEAHGFRSGLTGVENDPAVLDVVGIPETVQSVIPMPRPAAMARIIEALGAPAGAPAATPPSAAMGVGLLAAVQPRRARRSVAP